jgi:hypothetical protein
MTLPVEGATMIRSQLLWRYVAFLGVGVLLASAVWVCTRAAPPSVRDDETHPKITVGPRGAPEGSGTIDYGNAKPMPAPSMPARAQPTTPPTPPIPGGIMGQPGASPGSPGTGEQTPQVLVPPKR